MPKKVSTPQLRMPGPSNRTVVVGRTGSGKSQAAAWILSLQNFDEMPWVIIDYKADDDEIFNSLEKVQYIGYETVPDKPGIYVLRVLPGEEEELTAWLWRVWTQGNVGLFFDEGTMLGQYNKAFNACLVQGRSKRIPMIILSQRPVGLSTWAFSEASYWMVFDLTKVADRKTVESNTIIPRTYELEDYHSYWYDVAQKKKWEMGPVPDRDELISRIDERLPKQRRML